MTALGGVPDQGLRVQLAYSVQRTHGNAFMQQALRRTLPVQRFVDDAVIAALSKPDPVAGVGDYPTAFRILNGLSMYEILSTLDRLKRPGHFQTLIANLGQASDVNVARLRVAFEAVDSKGRVKPEDFAASHQSVLDELPDDQRSDIARYLEPSWIAPLGPDGLAAVADQDLGIELKRGLGGDAARLTAVEVEVEKREEQRGVGTWAPAAAPQTAPGVTNVSPDVAVQILENYSSGEAPFRPELGKGGCSWFVTDGSPYVGVDASKNIPVEVDIASGKDALVFTEKELLDINEQEAKASAPEAETAFRDRYRIEPDAPLSARLQKALARFQKQFAESRMWDRVGERVARSPGKVGKVILQNSQFSKQGNGAFAVVADAKKIKLRSGPEKLVESLSKSGIEAEPAVVEAAEVVAARMKWAGRVRGVFRYGGRILIVVAVAADVYKIYHARDHWKATFECVGGWAGAAAGAAAFSAMWTPADVAGPWAWAAHGVGTLVAGGVGYWVGETITRKVYEVIVED